MTLTSRLYFDICNPTYLNYTICLSHYSTTVKMKKRVEPSEVKTDITAMEA